MTCRYCGSQLPEGAMFCGECGRSVATTRHTIAPAVAASMRSDPTILPDAPARPVVEAVAPVTPIAPVSPVVPVSPVAEPVLRAEPVERAEPAVRDEPAVNRLPEATAGFEAFAPRSAGSPLYSPAPAVTGPIASGQSDLIDVENTRLTRPTQSGERFVLQFSTGESVTVFGTGLVGRNPASEPGEFFDHRVMIFDPSRSVSKTHLEFGQTAGEFWINDRFSGNGTGVRSPDSSRQHCDPGKRYMVARGSRVDIGEQFFIVS